MSAELMKLQFVRHPSDRLSVASIISELHGLLHGLLHYYMDFFQIFLVVASPGIYPDIFLIFENIFYEYFSFSLTWDPMGVKISKRCSSYKSQPKVLNFSWSFLSIVLTKLHLGFLNEFLIFNDFFFKHIKLTIVAYGEIKNLNYLDKELS